jgi:hypothetical protein
MGYAKSFSESRESKKVTWMKSLKWCRRMDLRTYNLSSGRLVKTLWWIRWRDVSRCRKAMRTHFMYPGNQIKRLGRSRLSDVSSRRMTLRTQNVPSGRLKRRLWRSVWSDVSRCGWAMCSHFLHLGNRKKCLSWSHLSGFNKRIALRPNNLPSERFNKPLWWSRWSYVSRCWKGVKTHFLHPANRYNLLSWSRLSDFKRRRLALRTHLQFSERLIKTT